MHGNFSFEPKYLRKLTHSLERTSAKGATANTEKLTPKAIAEDPVGKYLAVHLLRLSRHGRNSCQHCEV